MTRRILLTFLASTTLVMLGFLVPLLITVGNLVEAQAQREAVIAVQPLVNQLPLVPPDQVDALVQNTASKSRGELTVFLPDGTVLGVPAAPNEAVDLARRGRTFFRNEGDDEVLYAAAVGASPAQGVSVVRYVIPGEDVSRGVFQARLVLTGLGLVLMLVAGLVTWRLARSFLVPIRALADTADRLGSGDLTARVEPAGPPEIRNVGTLLNRLADRIDELLRGEREEVADLAHRLRTPVTALSLDADSLHDAAERDRMVADVDRLHRAVDEVIHEARRPVREGVTVSCDAVAVVRERTGFWSVLAEDQGRPYSVTSPEVPLPVRCASGDLGEAVDALLGNVFAHTPDGAALQVVLEPVGGGGGARLTVEDAGPGYPAHPVVERGTSGTGSTGLGLDIARRTAERSGGSFVVGQSEHLSGAAAIMLLGPVQAAAGATSGARASRRTSEKRRR